MPPAPQLLFEQSSAAFQQYTSAWLGFVSPRQPKPQKEEAPAWADPGGGRKSRGVCSGAPNKPSGESNKLRRIKRFGRHKPTRTYADTARGAASQFRQGLLANHLP